MNSECKELEMQLSAYADGELDAPLAARVSSHLRGCPRCQQALEEIRAIDSAAGCQTLAPVAEEDWAGPWQQIAASLPGAKRVSRFPAWARKAIWSGVAAAAILALLTTVYLVRPKTPAAGAGGDIKGCSVEAIDGADTPAICYYSEDTDLTIVWLENEDL